MSLNSLNSKTTLSAKGKTYIAYSIPAAAKTLGVDFARLPFSLKVLLENLLRNEDGKTVTKEDVAAFGTWLKNKNEPRDIAYRPARVLMQDFTGVPAVVDLASMRDAMAKMRRQCLSCINPLTPVDSGD